MNGHISLQRNRSPLLMLNAWLAQRASVAAHTVARASRPASVISSRRSQAPGLPGKRSGTPSSFDIDAYTAIASARFIGLPSAKPPTTEGRIAVQLHALPCWRASSRRC